MVSDLKENITYIKNKAESWHTQIGFTEREILKRNIMIFGDGEEFNG